MVPWRRHCGQWARVLCRLARTRRSIEGLLSVASDPVASDVVAFRDYLSSGAIDSEANPDSNLTENWPGEVQTAIARTQDFAAENC
jgi:hypothetical protein